MPIWIELHDSELISAARSDLEVSILLDAYAFIAGMTANRAEAQVGCSKYES